MDIQVSSGSGGNNDRGEMADGVMPGNGIKGEETLILENNKQKMQVVQDAVRNLEYATLRCDSVECLFGTELLSRRNKIKDMCEKTLFESPKALGLQLRERLWRSAFYDVFGRAKRLKKDKSWTPIEFTYMRNHLLSGVGQMNILLLKLQELAEFEGTNLQFRLRGGVSTLSFLAQGRNTEGEGGLPAEKWLIELMYSCLLNIGDLHRYLTEIYSQEKGDKDVKLEYYDQAQEYYSQAFLLNPENGMAHNQLGNLSIKLNGGLDSTYYLLYSLLSPYPYEGAFLNLRQLLDRQLVHYATLPASKTLDSMDVFTHRFLSMIYYFLCEAAHLNNFEKTYQDSIMKFINLLDDNSAVFEDRLLFRISLICIMTVWRLQYFSSPNVSAGVAFAIGLFVQIVEKLSTILQEHSHLQPEILPTTGPEGKNMPILDATLSATMESSGLVVADEVGNLEINGTISQQEVRRPKSSVPKRRKRNRCVISENFLGLSSSDEEYDEESDSNMRSQSQQKSAGNSSDVSDSDSELSESENELWSHTSESENASDHEVNEKEGAFGDSSEVSDTSYQAEIDRKVAELKLSQGSDNSAKKIDGKENTTDVVMKYAISNSELRECWSQVAPLLVATLPFMNWLRTTPSVQKAFASNCEKVVLEKFCQVFNLLSATNWSTVLCEDEAEKVNPALDGFNARVDLEQLLVKEKLQKDWNDMTTGDIGDRKLFQYELEEDRSLMGLQAFQDILNPLKREPFLSKENIMVIRIGRFVSFGHWLVGTDEFAVIHSDKSFKVPSVNEYRRHVNLQTTNHRPERMQNRLSKRRSLESKVLGKLLQDAKSEMPKKKRVRNNGNPRRERVDSFRTRNYDEEEKVFLFVDLSAVLKYFGIIRYMSRHPKFVIVFPHSVNRALDSLKDGDEKDSKNARIASRWLENASYKSNIVRILREHEKIKLNSSYPSVPVEQPLEFYDIMESCNFLRNHDLKGLRKTGHEFFSDIRDKYRLFYLTGHMDLIKPATIEAAQSFSVYLDVISRYERRFGRGRRVRSKKHSG